MEDSRGDQACKAEVCGESFDTALTADAVEFCPLPLQQGFLAVGCYHLLQQSQSQPQSETRSPSAEEAQSTLEGNKAEYHKRRLGHLLLYQVRDQALHEIERIPCRGVLDLKWCVNADGSCIRFQLSSLEFGRNAHEHNGGALLAGAHAEGHVTISHLRDSHLQSLASASLPDASAESLSLSLDWNDRLTRSVERRLVTSHTSGELAIWSVADDSSSLTCERQWTAHQNEAWIASFNWWDPNTVLSGSDDCTLAGWDIRTDSRSFVKRHDMGVTTIQSHPLREHYFASGCYDENVSVWDLRTMRRPVNVHATGGGVWRVKWHPRDPSLLAVACMHEGFQILKWTNDGEAGSQLETLVSYKGKHMSLGYGIDWSYGPVRDEASNEDLVASCSFYDHLLTLWKLVR